MIFLDTSVVLTDQGILAFCLLLVGIFGVMFRQINNGGDKVNGLEKTFLLFQQDTSHQFQLLQIRMGRRAEVGISNALDILSEPNPWSPMEMRIRDKMRQNPTLEGITDEEIHTVIKRLDEEKASLRGDKLMAADFMLMELNAELAERQAKRKPPEPPTPDGRPRWWMRGRSRLSNQILLL